MGKYSPVRNEEQRLRRGAYPVCRLATGDWRGRKKDRVGFSDSIRDRLKLKTSGTQAFIKARLVNDPIRARPGTYYFPAFLFSS